MARVQIETAQPVDRGQRSPLAGFAPGKLDEQVAVGSDDRAAQIDPAPIRAVRGRVFHGPTGQILGMSRRVEELDEVGLPHRALVAATTVDLADARPATVHAERTSGCARPDGMRQTGPQPQEDQQQARHACRHRDLPCSGWMAKSGGWAWPRSEQHPGQIETGGPERGRGGDLIIGRLKGMSISACPKQRLDSTLVPFSQLVNTLRRTNKKVSAIMRRSPNVGLQRLAMGFRRSRDGWYIMQKL